MTSKDAVEKFPFLEWKEEFLKEGDWVYTPNPVFGSSEENNQIFQYDPKINYSLDFGDELKFFKLEVFRGKYANHEFDIEFVQSRGGIE